MDNNRPTDGNAMPPAYPPSYPAPAFDPTVVAPPSPYVQPYNPPYNPTPAPPYAVPRLNMLGFILATVAVALGLVVNPLLAWTLLGGGLTGTIVLLAILGLGGIGLGIGAVLQHFGGFRPALTLGLATAGIALAAGWYIMAMFFWLARPWLEGVSRTVGGVR